jgi:hypothetical protein
MSNAGDRMRQATDVSLLNQLVLEVYLAAWTMTGVEDEQRLRPVAASSDDADDGETALDVVDLEHFIEATRGLDVGVHRGEIAERRYPSTSRGRGRLLQAGAVARLRSHRRRLGRRRDVRSERVGSVCSTTGPYLTDQTGDYSRGGSCVAF